MFMKVHQLYDTVVGQSFVLLLAIIRFFARRAIIEYLVATLLDNRSSSSPRTFKA